MHSNWAYFFHKTRDLGLVPGGTTAPAQVFPVDPADITQSILLTDGTRHLRLMPMEACSCEEEVVGV